MTSIASGYNLSSYLSGGSGNASGTSAGSVLQALQQSLSAASSSSKSANTGAYLLNLSPAAQQLLSGSASSSQTTGSDSTQFTLNATQRATVKNIVAKYKDAPFTQATFNSILGDLKKAGLSPQTLAGKDQAKSFNPTSQLLNALGGRYTGAQNPAATASGEDTKKTNYLQSIVSLWKSESTTAAKTTEAGT